MGAFKGLIHFVTFVYFNVTAVIVAKKISSYCVRS